MTNSNESTKAIPVVVAIMITTMTIASVTNNSGTLLPIASAQSKPDNVLGTIASIQNGKDGKPEWVTSGIVDFKGLNSNSPTFNATFNMFMLNGSAAHKHTITDFKMTGKSKYKWQYNYLQWYSYNITKGRTS
jgi:hypothetical protein